MRAQLIELTAPSLRLSLVSGSAKSVLTMSCGRVRRREPRRLRFPPAYLAVVKRAGDGDVVDVGVENGRHLRLLNRTYPAFGVQNKHRNVLLAPKTVDGSAARVAARGADDSQVMPVCKPVSRP